MPEIKDVSKEIRHLILFDHAATAKHFVATQVFDAQGKLIIDAASFDPVVENRADEEYFQTHRNQPALGLFISRPMLHRGAYSILLSRRTTGDDGSFLGVVAGSIRFSYFHDLFGRLSLGEDDVITVFRRDGTVIMRTPFDLDVIGHNLSHVPGLHEVLTQPSGSYSRPSVVDGLMRLFVWRNSGSALVVQVGKRLDTILNLWRRQATRIGAIMTGLILFLFPTALFLGREISRRAEAEERLEELATTDALTGLKNRRKVDSEVHLEMPPGGMDRTP